MQRKKLGLSLALAATVLLFVASFAYADIYWESEQTTKGVADHPDGTKVQKNYYTLNASRIDMGDGIVMIMDFDSGNIYQLNTTDKTYTETNMSELVPQSTSDNKKMQIRVTPTKETKTIAGYVCKKYNVNIMNIKSEYWLSKDVPAYRELKEIGTKMQKKFEDNPIMKQMNMAGMMDKLDGFPVRTISRISGGTMFTTLITVEQKPLSKDLFQVPADYTLQQSK